MKTIYASLITDVARLDNIEFKFKNKEPTYEEIREFLQPFFERAMQGKYGSANFEHVSVLYEGKRADMFVDEDGKMKNLPYNSEATAIYRANWLKQNPTFDPDKLDYIVGPAVLFHEIVWH